MMSCMTSAISGLKAHQTRMDVISNNIANVNTIGYKSSRVNFSELYARTTANATAPNSQMGTGGTNPQQLGLGVGIGSVAMNFENGAIESTDNDLDIAIDGDGFLAVRSNDAGEYYFTRAGALGVDSLGNLVTGDGCKVYGWANYELNNGEYTYNTAEKIEAINVYQDSYNGYKKTLEPESTTYATFSGNLNLENELGSNGDISIPINFYDSYGEEYIGDIKFSRAAGATDKNVWSYTISDGAGGTLFDNIEGTVSFDTTEGKEGDLLAVTDAEAADPTAALANNKLEREITFTGGNSDKINVTFDFGMLTQYASNTTAKVYDSDGCTAGQLVNYSIGDNGTITGVYSNGKQRPLAKIALATFENQQGLQRIGGNLYSMTTNSGQFTTISAATTAGSFVSKALELANVDLSTEFTDMIITERGFQANSKIITTADELLQELVNLKR